MPAPSLGSAWCGIVVGMGFLDKILGRDDRSQQPPGQQQWAPSAPAQEWGPPAPGQQPVGHPGQPAASEDERAIARYRYLLRTAPPEQVEEVHAEAFAKLTPEQRQRVLAQLTSDLPPGEAPQSDDPRVMARAATRAEMQQPGYMQRSFGGSGADGGRRGPGMGGMFAGSMLGSIAGVVVGSMVAQSLLGGFDQSPEAGDVGEGGEGAEGGTDGGQEAGGEDAGGGDFGGGDFGGGDFGGGFGDF